MSKLNMADIGLPQETLVIDEVEYLVTALPASYALQFMEKYQEAIQTGKSDLATMREVIVKSVCKDNKQITASSFDVLFARKYQHLHKLYNEIIEYNFASEGFQEDGGEE